MAGFQQIGVMPLYDNCALMVLPITCDCKKKLAGYLAERCEVQISYAIGLSTPMSLTIDAFGTEKAPLESIYNAVERNVDCRPNAIIRRFDLLKPVFFPISCYGHFGSNAADMPWEQTDIASMLHQ